VSPINCNITGQNGEYIIDAISPGMASIKVKGGNHPPVTIEFNVKSAPMPEIRLGNRRSGKISLKKSKPLKNYPYTLGI